MARRHRLERLVEGLSCRNAIHDFLLQHSAQHVDVAFHEGPQRREPLARFGILVEGREQTGERLARCKPIA
jgi:hypothetical protein